MKRVRHTTIHLAFNELMCLFSQCLFPLPRLFALLHSTCLRLSRNLPSLPERPKDRHDSLLNFLLWCGYMLSLICNVLFPFKPLISKNMDLTDIIQISYDIQSQQRCSSFWQPARLSRHRGSYVGFHYPNCLLRVLV